MDTKSVTEPQQRPSPFGPADGANAFLKQPLPAGRLSQLGQHGKRDSQSAEHTQHSFPPWKTQIANQIGASAGTCTLTYLFKRQTLCCSSSRSVKKTLPHGDGLEPSTTRSVKSCRAPAARMAKKRLKKEFPSALNQSRDHYSGRARPRSPREVLLGKMDGHQGNAPCNPVWKTGVYLSTPMPV